MMPPEVKFAVRYPAGSGAWRYEPLDIPHPGGSFMPLEYLPAAGDLVTLWDRSGHVEGGPHFRVVTRSWSYSGYGSVNWPYGQREPSSGPLVDIIVEPAGGPYSDEAPHCAEDDCGAMWIDHAWKVIPARHGEPDEHEHRVWFHDPTKSL